jgi:lysine 2,3-aminomutase
VWRRLPIYSNIAKEQFMDYKWQTKHSIDSKKLLSFLDSLQMSESIKKSVDNGIKKSNMNIKFTPYIASCINWGQFYEDPIRKQFIPIEEEIFPNHPNLKLDSLNEQKDSPVKGLIHRYPDKVLLLATSLCPLYCRFCTRSYSIGPDTELVKKNKMPTNKSRYEDILNYLQQNDRVHDVVLSGGDSYMLDPSILEYLGRRILEIKHIERIRIATKGLCAMPMKILTHEDWINTIFDLNKYAKENYKQLAIHTHFNHPNEINEITDEACQYLYKNNVTIRNQTVILRGINDNKETMGNLIRRLSKINIIPYYVYQCDMVDGLEYFRTPLRSILDLEKQLRGTIAGFLTPQFVVDLPGGGGKRLASSYEYYDEAKGISCYKAPAISGDKLYYYYDPIYSN